MPIENEKPPGCEAVLTVPVFRKFANREASSEISNLFQLTNKQQHKE